MFLLQTELGLTLGNVECLKNSFSKLDLVSGWRGPVNLVSSMFSSKFEFLKHEIFKFKEIMISGCGFFIIDGNEFNDFSKKELEQIFSIISQLLGELYVQNIKNC